MRYLNNAKKSILLIFVNILIGISCYAQMGVLKGNIYLKQSGEPVAGAGIYPVNDKSLGVASDADGSYEINLPVGKQTIVYTLTGLKNDTLTLDIKDGTEAIRNIYLTSNLKNLNVVVVSASKYEQRIEDITVSMEVISPKLIENRNTTNVTSVLEQTPGVTILDQEPQIRGGSGFSFGVGSRVATLIDGLPIMTGDAGRTEWQFIPVENIEQIEVIKGASSVLYGSSALSGTINFRTAYPKERYHTYLRTYGGVYDKPSNREAKWWDGPATFSGINFLHSEKINRWDLIIGGNGLYDHGFIGPPLAMSSLPFQDTTISNNDVASRWGRLNFNIRHRFKNIEGLSAGINGNFMQSHSNFSLVWANDSTGIYNAFPKTMTLTDSKTFYIDPYISLTGKKGSSHQLRSRIFYADNDNGNDQSNKTNVYLAEYRFNRELISLGRLNVTSGVYFQQSFSHASLYAGSGNDKNTLENYAAFIQLEKKLIKKLMVSAGFRAEYFEMNNKESQLEPILRAGLNYQLTEGTFIRCSYGQGYRYPTIAEKFIETGAGGISVFPNPEVQPESSWNAEAGIKQGFKIGNFFGFADIAVFEQRYHNTIEYIYALWQPDQLAGFKFVNTGNSRVKGLEVSIMGEGKPVRNFAISFLGGYTYTLPQSLEPDYIFATDNPPTDFLPDSLSYSSTSTDTSKNILKYRFQHIAKMDIEFTWKFISFGYGVRYYSFMKNIDKKFYDLDETVLPTGVKAYREKNDKGTLVHDLRLGFKLSEIFKASFLVNNATNLEYSLRPLKIESPRNYTIQLTAAF